jgi:hypothetical protein
VDQVEVVVAHPERATVRVGVLRLATPTASVSGRAW